MSVFCNSDFIFSNFFTSKPFFGFGNWAANFNFFTPVDSFADCGMYNFSSCSIFQTANPNFCFQPCYTQYYAPTVSEERYGGGNAGTATTATTTPKAPAASTLTPELKSQLLDGTYTGNSITLNGVTHYRYEDCAASDLVTVGSHKLHRNAAEAFQNMQAAARAEGVNLTVVSGFRSQEYQKGVFRKRGTDDATVMDRIKVSAPSGYSEHHTGYAIDINSTEESFKNTPAYTWLVEHASEYGFEISFPENNSQGLSFEPWHWRYVGTDEAKRTFATARAAR